MRGKGKIKKRGETIRHGISRQKAKLDTIDNTAPPAAPLTSQQVTVNTAYRIVLNPPSHPTNPVNPKYTHKCIAPVKHPPVNNGEHSK